MITKPYQVPNTFQPVQPGNPMLRGGTMGKPALLPPGANPAAVTTPGMGRPALGPNPAAITSPGMGRPSPLGMAGPFVPNASRAASEDMAWQPGQKTGTWLDDYMTPMGDAFTGTRGGRNYINGHPFAPEFLSQGAGPNGDQTSFAFGNALNTYQNRMKELGINGPGQSSPLGLAALGGVTGKAASLAGGSPTDNPAGRGPGMGYPGGMPNPAARTPGAGMGYPPPDGSILPPGGNPAARGDINQPTQTDTGTQEGAGAPLLPDSLRGFDANLSPVAADYSGVPGLDMDFSGAARRAGDAVYGSATQYLDHDFAKQDEALRSQLANQGFAVGSEGYNNELERMRRSQGATRERAAMDAVLAGNTEAGNLFGRQLAGRTALGGERERAADRTFGQGLGIASLGLQGRGQDLSRYLGELGNSTSRYGIDANTDTAGMNAELRLRELGLTEDNQGFQQLMQLIAGSRGGLNVPNFGAPGSVDVLGANSLVSGNNQFNSSQSAAANAARNAGLFQLGSILLGGMFK